MAPLSLQWSSTASDMLEITLSSDMNFLIQTASFVASLAAMYSVFVVELATVFCIELFKFTVLSFRQTQNLIAIVSHPCQFEGWLQCNFYSELFFAFIDNESVLSSSQVFKDNLISTL
ncbi:hypothetical protein V6N13_125218 [Hibiscus sabdariffa]